jgi:hypothetical protein
MGRRKTGIDIEKKKERDRKYVQKKKEDPEWHEKRRLAAKRFRDKQKQEMTKQQKDILAKKARERKERYLAKKIAEKCEIGKQPELVVSTSQASQSAVKRERKKLCSKLHVAQHQISLLDSKNKMLKKE